MTNIQIAEYLWKTLKFQMKLPLLSFDNYQLTASFRFILTLTYFPQFFLSLF